MRKIKVRSDTAANWNSINPVLLNGEFGINTTDRILKCGNGVSTWSNLVAVGRNFHTLSSTITASQTTLFTPNIPAGAAVMSVFNYLLMKVANNGYAVGDIVSIVANQPSVTINNSGIRVSKPSAVATYAPSAGGVPIAATTANCDLITRVIWM